MTRGLKAPGYDRPTSEKRTTNCKVRKQERSSENKKASKLLEAGDHAGRAYTATSLVAGAPKAQPHSQHFGLPASALGVEATEGPKLLLNEGPRALLHHWILSATDYCIVNYPRCCIYTHLPLNQSNVVSGATYNIIHWITG